LKRDGERGEVDLGVVRVCFACSTTSKAYLYNNQEIRNGIETLRKKQKGLPSPKQVKREMRDASKDVLIAAIQKN